MSKLLQSVKADLLDRRLFPLVAIVVLGLAGAVAWVALGDSSAPASAPHVASTGSSTPPGLAVTQTTSETAVAETTGGVALQHKGHSRDPFAPVATAKTSSNTATSGAGASAKSGSSSSSGASGSSGSGSSSSGSSGSGGSGSSSNGSGGSTPTTPSKPASPSKPPAARTVYHVAVLFGLLPATGGTPAQLTPYEDVKLLAPLPSAKQPLIVFRGVTVGGKSATFTLVSEAILHGNAACLPSASRCEAIDLKPGDSEQLEYVTAEGAVETYELKIVSIVSGKASSSAVKGILRGESKVGRELLSHAGLIAVPDLRYSSQPGVLVFAGRHRR
jgi:hypothetical protein